MTRLSTKDLRDGPSDLRAYDEQLKGVAHKGLLDLALMTTRMTLDEYKSKIHSLYSVAVIPITSGEGIIPKFSEKIAEVAIFLGLPCKVTSKPDLEGWKEALVEDSEVVVCADDVSFLAFNLVSRRVVNNSWATGEIYAAALYSAVGSIGNHPIGVLGLGPVGQAAVTWLQSKGARIIVYDKNENTQREYLSHRKELKGAKGVADILSQTSFLIDATNSADVVKAKELENRLILSAPGIPLGIDDPSCSLVELIHDPLQLGAAAMMVQVLAFE